MAPPFFLPSPRAFDPVSYLDSNARRRPAAAAVYDAGRNVSFEGLDRIVHGLVAHFRASDLAEGEPVAVRLANRWEYVALELAIPAAGGVIMPLPLTLGEAEMRWAMEKSGARRLIAESDLVLTATRAHRGKVAAMYPKVLRQVFTFRDFADLVAGVDGLSARVTQTDPRAWVRQVTEEAAASRGLKPPLEPAQADIVDPFRREDEAFTTMAQQIVGSMPAVVRALVG